MDNDKQMEIRRDIDDHELRIDELEYDVKELKEDVTRIMLVLIEKGLV